MSIKSKLLAGAAALALVGGVGTVGAMTAAAATPSCGQNCIDIFSRAFGTHRTPNFVMDVLRQGAKVGQPIILFRTSKQLALQGHGSFPSWNPQPCPAHGCPNRPPRWWSQKLSGGPGVPGPGRGGLGRTGTADLTGIAVLKGD
jgi:hypothetical protein